MRRSSRKNLYKFVGHVVFPLWIVAPKPFMTALLNTITMKREARRREIDLDLIRRRNKNYFKSSYSVSTALLFRFSYRTRFSLGSHCGTVIVFSFLRVWYFEFHKYESRNRQSSTASPRQPGAEQSCRKWKAALARDATGRVLFY